jgi:hypothetical protein
VFALPEGVDASGWPMTIGVAEDWYIKPDAGMMLGSPANADPVPPQDVQAEELDIALAIDRIEAGAVAPAGRGGRAGRRPGAARLGAASRSGPHHPCRRLSRRRATKGPPVAAA